MEKLVGLLCVITLVFGVRGIPKAEIVNLANLCGIATASSYYAPYNQTPDKAIDGNYSSMWSAVRWGTPTIPEWLIVDLQDTYKIDEIVLNYRDTSYEDSFYINYNLYTSQDITNWNFLTSGILRDSAIDYYDVIPISGEHSIMQYIKYEVDGGTHWAGLFEIEIYGDSNPVPLPSTILLFSSGFLSLLGIGGIKKKGWKF